MKTGFFIVMIIVSLSLTDKLKSKVVNYVKSKYSSINSNTKVSKKSKRTYSKQRVKRSIASLKKSKIKKSRYKKINKWYTSEDFGHKKGATCLLKSVRKFKKRGKWYINTKMACQGRIKLQHKVRKSIIASL